MRHCDRCGRELADPPLHHGLCCKCAEEVADEIIKEAKDDLMAALKLYAEAVGEQTAS